MIEGLDLDGNSVGVAACAASNTCLSPYDDKPDDFLEFNVSFGKDWIRLLSNIVTDDIMDEFRARADDADADRLMDFGRGNGEWVINGNGWGEADIGNEVSATKIDALQVGQDGAELWRLKGHGGWFHPVHIHLVEFFIILRDGAPVADNEDGKLHP